MLFTRPELREFFIKYYEKMNNQDDMFSGNGNKSKFLLKELNANGSIKCMIYIGATKFWPELPNYWKNLRGTKYSFSDGAHAVKEYIKKSKDIMLKKDITLKVA